MKSKWMFLVVLFLFISAPQTAWAAEEAPARADAQIQSSDAEAPAEQVAAPGCPGAEGGKCCGACQTRARLAKKAGADMGGCPCQKARQAREGR